MKKLYFSILMIFGGLTVSNAQLLTQSNHAPAIGETFRTTDCSTVSILPGSGGTGQTWNFSTVSINTLVTDYSVVAVPSSSAASYPSANVAVRTGTTSDYSFYNSSAASLQYWGGNIVVGTFNIVLTFTSASVYAKYPMAFGTTTSNAVGGSINALGNTGTFTGSMTASFDGTGSLILPARTFTNALRVVTSSTLNFQVPSVLANGTVYLVTYEYFSPVTKSALFSIANSTIDITSPIAQNQIDKLVTVNTDYQYVGINESVKEIANLNIYPNPAKTNFTLSFVNENADVASYELTNTLGQTIKKENLGNEKGLVNYSVNIIDLQAGVYFVKVNAGAKSSTKKLTIQ